MLQAAAEPMQVDGASEENDNVEEVSYIVENTSLVSRTSYRKHYKNTKKLYRKSYLES